MKTVFFTAILGMVCISTFAQGQLNFANFGGGANAPIFDTDGTTKLGSTFAVDLYWAPGTVTDSTVLTALGQPASFSGSGYFLGGTRTIPGQPGGITITAQVRVWDWAHGASWTQASTVPGGRTGESALFQIVLTVPPAIPNTLTGLSSFYLHNDCLDCNYAWPVAAFVQSYGANGLLFSWPGLPNAGRYRVQQNVGLNPTHWVTLLDQPVWVGQPPPMGSFQVTLPKPAGTMFYRLVWQ